MKIQLGFLVFGLLITSLMARAQSPVMSQADRKAYLEAIRTPDPQKKIEALEKFVADFPNSFNVASAHQTILDTLVKNWPGQKEKILAQALKFINATPEPVRGNSYSTVANSLAEAAILLDQAEEFAAKGLALTEEELAKTARQRRAAPLATLGRVYLKNGKTKQAEKALKEAYEANPSSTTAAVGLAEIAEKAGDNQAAINYLMSAALSGRLTAAQRQQFEALYRKTHQGSLAGLEEMLDAKYRKDFPKPFEVEAYKPAASRTHRLVLAEVFTGSGCPPCVAADLGFDAAMERYPHQDLTVVMYHLHIPLPDPMTNPSTQARSKYYGVGGVPSYVIDGEKNTGGGAREAAKGFYDRIKPSIESRLAAPAEANIKLDAALEASAVKVKATVDQVKGESNSLKLQIALVEDKLRFSGENGIRFHPMVVRSLAGADAGGFAVDPAKPTTAEWSFDLAAITAELKKHLDDYEASPERAEKYAFVEKKHAIDPGNLSVVAFVQDDKSKKILQASYLKVKSAVTSSGR